MLSTRQIKRGRDRAREARWAAAQPEQLQQQTSTTTAPAVAPGGDELQPLWAKGAAAAAAPQAAAAAAAPPPPGQAPTMWQLAAVSTSRMEQAALVPAVLAAERAAAALRCV